MNKNTDLKSPHVLVSIMPLAVLVVILCLVLRSFGSDALSGGSQTALLAASAVCVALGMAVYRLPWQVFEEGILRNVGTVAPALIILLLIGAISGTWMTSGIVPTLIDYGLRLIHPRFFLVATCIICAVIAIMTGSSWTTIATIGVALLGIGVAQGHHPGWIAGAIISGAYFGDKISPLSDTTVLASSSCGAPLFRHIRYMLITTIPAFVTAMIIFAVSGFHHEVTSSIQIEEYREALQATFHITPWLLLVPVVTCVMIAMRLPSIITLFSSAVLAGVCIPVFQPQLVADIAGEQNVFKSVILSLYGSTAIDTGYEALNELVTTRGMAGMLNTVWLIICAMCFGGVMTGSGMLRSITSLFLRMVRRRTGVVASTVGSGIFLNMCTGDQYLSIILTGNLFKGLYKRCGFESCLLSRSVEDSATVVSVLIPWNSCGMTQSTILGVGTMTYLPYCFFNLLSPVFSILVAASGYKIRQHFDPRTGDVEREVSSSIVE